jgi:hypothetical protein
MRSATSRLLQAARNSSSVRAGPAGTATSVSRVTDEESAGGTAVVFFDAVKEIEFQMLDIDLGFGDLSFFSNGFRCEALTAKRLLSKHELNIYVTVLTEHNCMEN